MGDCKGWLHLAAAFFAQGGKTGIGCWETIDCEGK